MLRLSTRSAGRANLDRSPDLARDFWSRLFTAGIRLWVRILTWQCGPSVSLVLVLFEYINKTSHSCSIFIATNTSWNAHVCWEKRSWRARLAFDEPNLLLYVQLFQIFRIWVIPFYYAPVELTTVITLEHNQEDGKYYIAKQNDLYQVDQFMKFLVPGSWVLVLLWQFWATFFCIIGVILGVPITWVEENWLGYLGEGNGKERTRKKPSGWWSSGRDEFLKKNEHKTWVEGWL